MTLPARFYFNREYITLEIEFFIAAVLIMQISGDQRTGGNGVVQFFNSTERFITLVL